MPTPIVIVGAGVIGLTTALSLKREDADRDITLAASRLPGDVTVEYTSPFAGANWQSFAGDNIQLQRIDEIGYHELLRLADVPTSGVWKRKNLRYQTKKAWDAVHGDVSAFTNWYDKLTNCRILDESELRPGTVHGTEFDGLVISVPFYLSYLVQKCLELGIVIKRVTPLKDIEEARYLHSTGKKAALVINCTGLGACRLQGLKDSKRSYPVKGQVVLVSNSINEVVLVDDVERPHERLYAFPRKEGGTIIGGCFLENDWSAEEDKEMTQRILSRAIRFIPELIDPASGNPDHLHVVEVNVGLRPFREGGARIERDLERPWIIHAYGAGSGGYQGSYGFAQCVAELLRTCPIDSKM